MHQRCVRNWLASRAGSGTINKSVTVLDDRLYGYLLSHTREPEVLPLRRAPATCTTLCLQRSSSQLNSDLL